MIGSGQAWTRGLPAAAAVTFLLAGGCSSPRPADPPTHEAIRLHPVFDGIRVDAAAGVVEFDAVVSPLLVPDPRAPLFFLEQVVCSPDTREHESLLVTRVRPSHLHAALLLAGFQPGEPGRWEFREGLLIPVDPSGSRVQVRFLLQPSDATPAREVDPVEWIASTDGRRSIVEPPEHGAVAASPVPAAGWVFSGSRIVRGRLGAKPDGQTGAAPEVYAADGAGTVIGLTSFGSEVVSWSRTISPDAGVDAPTWIAKMDAIPAAGSPVIVRISREP